MLNNVLTSGSDDLTTSIHLRKEKEQHDACRMVAILAKSLLLIKTMLLDKATQVMCATNSPYC